MVTISLELFRKFLWIKSLVLTCQPGSEIFFKLPHSSLLPKGSFITGIGFRSVYMLVGVVYNYFLSCSGEKEEIQPKKGDEKSLNK